MGASGDRSRREALFPNRARTATDEEGVWESDGMTIRLASFRQGLKEVGIVEEARRVWALI